ncbi:hypothetical protein BBJ28_00024051 [Nothophytophthora sp. Chile5]|nr:hypothetical protein BBJ28_00024051 [Nothophytophthora sp. Chile5]
MASTSSAAAGGRKRKRSAFGCVHEGNDVLVEDLQALRQRVRESSHLASNYGRAISSIRAYPTPVRSASEAKKLKNIGNYLANQIHSILRKRQLLGSADAASDAPPPAPVAPVEPPQAASLATITTERPPREYAPAYRKREWPWDGSSYHAMDPVN